MKIGIVGTGKVASWFVKDLAFNKYRNEIEISGLYNISITEGQKFAKEYNVKQVYDTWEAFLNADFDLVYLATPSSTHYDLAKELIDHKFNVYCEKPIALNYEQAKTLYQRAAKNKVLFFDGIKAPFSPAYQAMKQDLKSGLIGDILLIHSPYLKVSTSLKIPEPTADQKIWGFHLEAGMYGIFLPLDLAGKVTEYHYFANSYQNNKALATSALLMRHHNNVISTATNSDHTTGNLQATIHGSKGYITLGGKLDKYNKDYHKDSLHMAYTYQVYDLANNLIKEYDQKLATEGEGLVFTQEHVFELIKNKQTVSNILMPEVSLMVIKLLEETNQAK